MRQLFHRTTLWDFRADTFDGRPVNQDEVVVGYIEEEVIRGKR
ncbi:hypothetical protein [Litoribacter ruber]|nr:hypothetical protein [Litoribacter ruber]